MRVLRALFNFAIVNYEDEQGRSLIEQNPVLCLSLTRAWYPRKVRRNKIERSQLAAWFQAVNDLRGMDIRSIGYPMKHCLILILLTGLRREEALQLVWADRLTGSDQAKHVPTLDLDNQMLCIPDPKNRQPHQLPLTDYLLALFTDYKQHNASKYVFPNAQGTKPIIEPKRIICQVRKVSGVQFTLHDLRRTFASIAESLDIPAYALKRLLNHCGFRLL